MLPAHLHSPDLAQQVAPEVGRGGGGAVGDGGGGGGGWGETGEHNLEKHPELAGGFHLQGHLSLRLGEAVKGFYQLNQLASAEEGWAPGLV